MDFDRVYNKNDVICRQGDPFADLFFLKQGRLLICTIHGTEVKVLARIEPGEFVGELSFFDGQPRSTHVVALEKCVVSIIPKGELMGHLPYWFVEAGKNLTKKIRLLDEVVHEKRIRKIGSEDQKPLSIEEQRALYAALTN